MRTIMTAAAIAMALSLTACDNSDSGSKSDKGSISVSNGGKDYTVTSADGKKQMHVSASAEAPANMPEFASLYPGARVQASLTGDQSRGPGGGGVNFMTTASPADVIAFYRKKAKAAGMEESMNNASAASAMLVAENTQDKTGLHVVAINEGGQTNVQLYWNSPKN